MKELAEHMVLNPELKKSFDDKVRKSKAKAKQDVRKFSYLCLLNDVVRYRQLYSPCARTVVRAIK